MAKWLRRQTHMFKVPGSIPTMGKISLPKTPTKKNVYRHKNENIGVHRGKNRRKFPYQKHRPKKTSTVTKMKMGGPTPTELKPYIVLRRRKILIIFLILLIILLVLFLVFFFRTTLTLTLTLMLGVGVLRCLFGSKEDLAPCGRASP